MRNGLRTGLLIVFLIAVPAGGQGAGDRGAEAPDADGAGRAPDPSRRDFFRRHAPSVVMITAVQTPAKGAVNRTRDLLRPWPVWSIPLDALQLALYPVRVLLLGPIKAGGSGVIIDDDGHVLTNHHVIEDANVLWVTLHDRRVVRATLVGSDADEDFALLRMQVEEGIQVRPAKLGRSADVRPGDRVYAIGSPLRLHQTFSAGQISGIERREQELGPFQDYLQMDLTIGAGSSGGPLFNANGEVVGLTTLMFATLEETGGVTMAVPIDNIREGLGQLKKEGAVTRGFLGAHIKDCTPRVAKKFGLQARAGACIWELEDGFLKGSPARRAGLRPGDVIVQWGKAKIDRAHTLARAVLNTKPGTRVAVTYVRGERRESTTVTVKER
jgi:S1-C subfamily serine protease